MIERAAVLVGVRKTGGLPTLQAVDRGIAQMQQWAAAQPGMKNVDGELRIVTLTDAGGAPVTAQAVRTAIKAVVDDGVIEQLIVYFAGHGANVRYNEYWLLSGAPDDANEAVNVEASIPLARQSGIPHVVLISDACRTAAASIQSQAVQGSIVFPNNSPRPNPGCVDVFYATLVGKPALEVTDPNAPSQFDAVYTVGLVNGLAGEAKVETDTDAGQTVQRIRPWPLKRYLASAVPQLLTQRNVNVSVSQSPDAIITSAPEAWISQLVSGTTTGVQPAPTRGVRSTSRRVPDDGSASSDTTSLAAASQEALRSVLDTKPAVAPRTRGGVTRGPATRGGTRGGGRGRGQASTGAQVFATVLDRTGVEHGPPHFESKCGFKVNGSPIQDVAIGGGRVEVMDAANGLFRIWDVPKPAANVLIVFADGRGALLPAIPDFIGTLTYRDGDLSNITYEPSDNSDKWAPLQSQLPELRELRRVVATAAELGVFRPENVADREEFVRRLRETKGLDPTMAVYAAYALHTLQRRDEIAEVDFHVKGALQFSLFDVAMLARTPRGGAPWLSEEVFPAVPLLSQAWALLDLYDITLPAALQQKRLFRHVGSSLWTVFDPTGVDVVRNAFAWAPRD